MRLLVMVLVCVTASSVVSAPVPLSNDSIKLTHQVKLASRAVSGLRDIYPFSCIY